MEFEVPNITTIWVEVAALNISLTDGVVEVTVDVDVDGVLSDRGDQEFAASVGEGRSSGIWNGEFMAKLNYTRCPLEDASDAGIDHSNAPYF